MKMTIRAKALLVAALAFAMAGCAMSVKQGYEGAQRPDSELAIIETFIPEDVPPQARSVAYLSGVYGEWGSVLVGTMQSGFPRITKTLPGRATLGIHCALPKGSASELTRRLSGAGANAISYSGGGVPTNLKKGTRYYLKCEPTPGHQSRIWIEEVPR
jgi:hypothetical protein